MQWRKKALTDHGFTRVELLAAVGAISLFCLLLAPVHGRSLANAHLSVCMSNLRQLTKAWQMFAEAHEGVLPRNVGAESVPNPALPVNVPWATGWVSWDNSSDNTNTLKLADAALGPYLNRNARVFKCPSDSFVSAAQRRFGGERPRSYSLNGFVGRSRSQAVFGHAWNHYDKLQDIRDLSPDRLFLILDEHPDSINDPSFFIDPDQPRWLDYPAGYHQNGASISFADGHVEHKIWLEPETVPPVKFQFPSGIPRQPALDYNWLKARATMRVLQ